MKNEYKFTAPMRVITIQLEREPELVISLLRTSVNTYSLITKGGIKLANILFTPLRILVNAVALIGHVIIAVFAIISLLILTITLIFMLGFGNSFFFLLKTSIFEEYKKLNRDKLIDKHLRIETSFRSLERIKGSGFLFKTPFLGWLNTTFYNNLKESELVLRKFAYPNLGKVPVDLPIHDLDPSDVWQDDLDEYSSEEILSIK